jgi:hypothetical protein
MLFRVRPIFKLLNRLKLTLLLSIPASRKTAKSVTGSHISPKKKEIWGRKTCSSELITDNSSRLASIEELGRACFLKRDSRSSALVLGVQVPVLLSKQWIVVSHQLRASKRPIDFP